LTDFLAAPVAQANRVEALQGGSEAKLKALGVTQVVIAGVATATGVEATARQAYEQGFNVTLAIDAMTDRRPEAHDYSLNRVFPRLGETGTSQEIIDLLRIGSA
jgi:nicotinamidase-related amidase